MAVYPGSIPPAGSASASDTLAAAGHTSLHNTDRDEIRALATKMGTGASTAAAGTVLRATGAGTSAWGQVDLTTDVTGILPTANGGTGQNDLTGLPLVGPIITGGGSWSDSPTLETPVIDTPSINSFAEANHDHEDDAGGGQLSTGAYADNSVTYAKLDLSGMPRCSAVATGAQTVGNGGVTGVTFDTELYDVGGCHSTSSNTSRFTAPENGLYALWGHVTFAANTAGRRGIFIMKNGSFAGGTPDFLDWSTLVAATLSATIAVTTYEEHYLVAGDYLELGAYQDSGGNLDTVANRARAGFRKVAE